MAFRESFGKAPLRQKPEAANDNERGAKKSVAEVAPTKKETLSTRDIFRNRLQGKTAEPIGKEIVQKGVIETKVDGAELDMRKIERATEELREMAATEEERTEGPEISESFSSPKNTEEAEKDRIATLKGRAAYALSKGDDVRYREIMNKLQGKKENTIAKEKVGFWGRIRKMFRQGE